MSTTSFHVLFESASGYALFSVLEGEEIGALLAEVQAGTSDFSKFQRVVKMTGFVPFETAEHALENINAITEHEVTDDLKAFLESNLSKGKKSTKSPLGVIEPTLATAIQENLGIPCRSDETIRELNRGIRLHFTKFVKPLQKGLLEQAQLGLGHAYSRSKVRRISFFLRFAFHSFVAVAFRVHIVLLMNKSYFIVAIPSCIYAAMMMRSHLITLRDTRH